MARLQIVLSLQVVEHMRFRLPPGLLLALAPIYGTFSRGAEPGNILSATGAVCLYYKLADFCLSGTYAPKATTSWPHC